MNKEYMNEQTNCEEYDKSILQSRHYEIKEPGKLCSLWWLRSFYCKESKACQPVTLARLVSNRGSFLSFAKPSRHRTSRYMCSSKQNYLYILFEPHLFRPLRLLILVSQGCPTHDTATLLATLPHFRNHYKESLGAGK
jgi:hypothetical protein